MILSCSRGRDTCLMEIMYLKIYNKSNKCDKHMYKMILKMRKLTMEIFYMSNDIWNFMYKIIYKLDKQTKYFILHELDQMCPHVGICRSMHPGIDPQNWDPIY